MLHTRVSDYSFITAQQPTTFRSSRLNTTTNNLNFICSPRIAKPKCAANASKPWCLACECKAQCFVVWRLCRSARNNLLHFRLVVPVVFGFVIYRFLIYLATLKYHADLHRIHKKHTNKLRSFVALRCRASY